MTHEDTRMAQIALVGRRVQGKDKRIQGIITRSTVVHTTKREIVEN